MYREVTMIEVREVLRLRGEGLPKKRIAAQLGLDPKTVRRYLTAAADRRRPRDGDGQRRGGPPGPARAASGRRSAAGRRLVEQARAGDRGYRARLLGADVDQLDCGAALEQRLQIGRRQLTNPRASCAVVFSSNARRFSSAMSWGQSRRALSRRALSEW